MQDEVNEKCVSVVINGGKISARVLTEAIVQTMRNMETNEAHDGGQATYRGKVRLSELAPKGGELSNIEITDKNIRSFEKYARKYQVSYSLKKDRSREPPRYLVFFRAKDTTQMEAAFKEYTGFQMKKDKLPKKPSVIKRLRQKVAEASRNTAKERTKEKVRNEAR